MGGEAFHSSEAGFYVSLCLLYMWGCVNCWNSGHPGALFVSPSRSCGQWTWGGKCWLRCQSCAVSKKKEEKIAIRWADRRNNKHGGLERRLNKYKGRETGRKRGQIRCWIVEFIVRRTAPSPTTREPRDDPPLFFFCSEKTVFASFQWWHKHCIVAALKSFLSNDTCSLAFLSNKRSF